MTPVSARIGLVLNGLSLLASIPVWVMARAAASWSGGSENWDALFLFLWGGGILAAQAAVMLGGLVLVLCNLRKWTRREKWIMAASLPLPVISTLLAFACSSPR